jgi:hypothetical protein
MRKSLELQSQAIDEAITTMSQIAMLDTALGYTALRPHAEVKDFEDDAAEHLDSLFMHVQTPDVDAELLDKIAASMLSEFGDIAAERFVQSEIGTRISRRRENLVAQLEHSQRQLQSKRLRVIPHANNIVYRGYPYPNHKYTEQLGLPPIQAEEALTIMTNLRKVLRPNRYYPPGDQRAFYGRYVGYSIGGFLLDKREGKGKDHYISLVTASGVPQVTITPA